MSESARLNKVQQVWRIVRWLIPLTAVWIIPLYRRFVKHDPFEDLFFSTVLTIIIGISLLFAWYRRRRQRGTA